ncbi:MAG TPA: dihydroorotate dehydrogenase 2 [Actinomycetota bacterium]
MGLYRAVAKPAFFALPPEAAHGLANLLLGLPLPWAAIGGAASDPAVQIDLAGISLQNPIGLAAGFDKTCRHLDALGRLGFGYVVGGTITRLPRRGNPKPRIARYRRRRSMANSMGLPNPGADAAARNLAGSRRTTPRVVSIADQDTPDVLATHDLLEPHVDAVELNASCPNVSWGRDRDNEAHLAELLRALGARRAKPLFVKLPPFRTDVERQVVLALAGIAQEGGADALTCSNTYPVRERRLAVGSGGLSGRDVFPDTVRIVAEMRRTTGAALPLNACGGVSTSADALACIEAGATTVQIYTGLVYEGPRIVGSLTRGLSAALEERMISLPSLVGLAQAEA